MHGTLTPDLNIYSHTDGQQYDGMMVKEREISNEAITALERHFASRFHLDEVMPQFFQADASTGSQSARVVSRISDLVQAEKILFLIANNLVNRWSIVGILKEIFEKGQRHLLANLFRLKQSSTVRAFSCRIMEAISAAAKSSDGQWLLEELLSCGLDRSLLEGITGGRCLQLAIYKRCTKMALYLLRNGVQRNPKLGVENPFNKTPIGLAEFYCQHKVVQLLRELENQPKNETPRVSILAPYRESVTVRSLKKALYRQSTEHIIELTQALVASGVDIDCDRGKGLHSRELLLNMAYFVNRECYEILLPHSIFAQKFLTTSGLMSAASAGLKHLEQYLDSRSWHSTVKCQGSLQHMIQEATISGLEEEVCTLLSAKRIFEEIDASALFDWAVRYDRAKIIVALLKCDDASDVIFELLNNSKSSEVSGIFTLKVASFQRELINHALSSFQSGDKILERIFDFGWPFPWNDIFRTSLDQFFRRGIDRFDVAAMKTFDSLPAFQILLSRGFDLNTEMISGSSCCHQTFTPLYCAIECGQPELLEYMIDAGADVNYMGRKCGDPWGGDSEITLLELSLHKTDFSRRKKEDLKIFQLLLKHGANINQPHTRDEGISWNTALTTAILNPYANEQIFLALEAGADINQQGCGIKARTPLRAAVEGGRVDIVVELLRRGANINAPPAETYGRTALQAICSSESTSTELALLLIERGADINAPAGKYGGITALQGAAIAGNMKIAIILIDRDVDVNAPAAEEEGRMALDGAAEHGRIDMVKLLLNFQATCMEPGHTGYDSAISFAEENGHFVVADMLREHSCPVQSEVLDCDMSDFVIF